MLKENSFSRRAQRFTQRPRRRKKHKLKVQPTLRTLRASLRSLREIVKNLRYRMYGTKGYLHLTFEVFKTSKVLKK